MRVVFIFLLAVYSSFAYDVVIFSNGQKIGKDSPTLENILSTASVESPVVFLVNPDFTLGQFSKHVSAYSVGKSSSTSHLTSIIKASKSHAARFIEQNTAVPTASVITSAESLHKGSAVYIVAGEDWTTMESLSNAILPQLGNTYTAILAATDFVSNDPTKVHRVKRVSVMDDEKSGNSEVLAAPSFTKLPIPIILPPYNVTLGNSLYSGVGKTVGSCMLYMEGLDVVVLSKGGKTGSSSAVISLRDDNSNWNYDDTYVKCDNGTVGNYTFTISMTATTDIIGTYDSKPSIKINNGDTFSVQIVITGDTLGYWQLTSATATGLVVQDVNQALINTPTTAGALQTVNYVGMNSVQGFGFSCGNTQAAFFKTDNPAVFVGVAFFNIQVQPFGVHSDDGKTDSNYKGRYFFSRQVDDCVGTFSTGSWMGIISVLVMLTGFIFGYLMLNSVQTMDRFDDPKHKQIVINVRE